MGSRFFARLALMSCVCPDLENGHRNAHGQKAVPNCNDRELGKEKATQSNKQKEKKNKRKEEEKENTLKAFFP